MGKGGGFMKKWTLFLSLYFCACLLAACTARPVPEEAGDPPPEPTRADIICRVVTVEDDQLLLAGMDGDRNIYSLSWEDTKSIRSGDLVTVTYDGNVLEIWPASLGNVCAVSSLGSGFDDRCALYLQVLEDLWEVDPGLNGDDLTYIGMDLSTTSLSESERAAVAWAFAQKHGGELVTGTWEELAEQGYIDREHLQWEDGCLFSITELEVEGTYSLTPVIFDAQKWRSGLGAYFFCDCTSVQSSDGHWDGYSIGSEAIS